VNLEELREKSDDWLIEKKAHLERCKVRNDASAPANIALIDYVLAERTLAKSEAKSEQAASRSELMMKISVVAAVISAIAAVYPLLK
jgi:hypothetical protein